MTDTPTPAPVRLEHDVVGTGPPLVLVHGITENRHSWDPLVGPLAETYTVVAVDVRGHGTSPADGTYDLQAMAHDVRALVTDLGLADPLLVGHSMGGLVVTAYAAGGGARAVLNVDQSLDLGAMQAQVQGLEPLLRSDAFEGVVGQMFEAMMGALPDAEHQRLRRLRAPRAEVVLGVWAPLLELSAEDLDALVGEVVGGVEVPYLALHGIDPGDGYGDWLRTRIPSAELEVWDGLGHHPHLVDPERFVARVRAFDPAG